MKWIAKFFGLVFILAGIVVAGFTVETAKNNLDSIPVLLAPVKEAEAQAEALMEEVRQVAIETLTDAMNYRGKLDRMQLKKNLKDDLTRFLYAKTKKKPMILPVLMDV